MQTEYQTQCGATLWMTAEQAERWNAGDSTEEDYAAIIAVVPSSSRGLPTSDDMPLVKAEQQFPDWYQSMIDGQPVAITQRGLGIVSE